MYLIIRVVTHVCILGFLGERYRQALVDGVINGTGWKLDIDIYS